VALLHILLAMAPRLSLRLGVAHLNHALRPTDSEKEAEFVESLAKAFHLPFYIKKEDVRKYQREKRLSLEEAARRVRYTFYNRVAKRHRFNKIALGHHSDDNAELVLMNLMRGSGPLGISGIPPVREGRFIRPLIRVKRSDIIDFSNLKGVEYLTDASNTQMNYFRNRIRHHLLPALKKSYNPRIVDTLNRLAAILRSEEEWIAGVIAPVFKKSTVMGQGDAVALSVPRLDGMHLAEQRRVVRKAVSTVKGNLRSVTLSHIDAVIGLLNSRPARKRLDLPGRVRIRLEEDILLFSKEKKPLRDLEVSPGLQDFPLFEYEIEAPGSIFIPEIGTRMTFSEIAIENVPDVRRTGHHTDFFDMDALCFPLVVRNYRPGDRFTPLGMKGSQKVKKFFINNKVPKSERLKCPILLSQGNIVWVAGHRIDASARLTPATRNVLKAELFLA
jgi:tRNA(Ile)-lysidine synthase